MQKHLIYIATDANRLYLEVDYCQDISSKFFELQSTTIAAANSSGLKLSRIVLIEAYTNYEQAMKRKSELTAYTRMMKERIIRKQNPNWLSLVSINALENKKAVAYARAMTTAF